MSSAELGAGPGIRGKMERPAKRTEGTEPEGPPPACHTSPDPGLMPAVPLVSPHLDPAWGFDLSKPGLFVPKNGQAV